jgi:hypothetical protein
MSLAISNFLYNTNILYRLSVEEIFFVSVLIHA